MKVGVGPDKYTFWNSSLGLALQQVLQAKIWFDILQKKKKITD